MLGLASRTEAAVLAQLCDPGQRACLTLSHTRAAGGTAQVCADWAFVSGVSPVPPYLELIENYRNGAWLKHGRLLVGAQARVLRQVGQAQQTRGFEVRPQAWNTGETGDR